MSRVLSKEEIGKRLIQLRNLEVLHEAQRFKIWNLRDENRAFKKEISFLRTTVAEQQKTIDDLKLQMEELKTIVFGRKRRKEDTNDDDDISSFHAPPSALRPKESYRRRIPGEDEITRTQDHPIDRCNRCSRQFSDRDTIIYFEEDIPLPPKKIVIKHIIEKGYCGYCGAWSRSCPLPSAAVVLGSNVKRYITYLGVICRLSYAQIQDTLKQTYDFNISQGEIAKILGAEGERLRPEYERLKARIRGEPSVHLDETGWNLFIGDGCQRYAWTMVGGKSSDAVFVFGKTRGKGNVNELLGNSNAVVVSDDYGAYRKIANPHQLCGAHILRKLRDLATSAALTNTTHDHCRAVYQTFAGIYRDIETARVSSTPGEALNTLQLRLDLFASPHSLDIPKLSRIKEQVAQRSSRYLTCLLYPDVAFDNNAAERSLRHLVLKRKISFGSLTERTAETLAILSSVLLSWKQRGELRNYLIGV